MGGKGYPFFDKSLLQGEKLYLKYPSAGILAAIFDLFSKPLFLCKSTI